MSLLNLILGFLFQLINTFASLIGAWNTATPTPIPGMPNCATNPQSSGLLCIGLWMLENTVLSGHGALLIPLIITIGSAFMLLWFIGVVKRTVLKIGGVL